MWRLKIALLSGVFRRTVMNIGSLRPSFRNCRTRVIFKSIFVNSSLTVCSEKELGIPLKRTLRDLSWKWVRVEFCLLICECILDMTVCINRISVQSYFSICQFAFTTPSGKSTRNLRAKSCHCSTYIMNGRGVLDFWVAGWLVWADFSSSDALLCSLGFGERVSDRVSMVNRSSFGVKSAKDCHAMLQGDLKLMSVFWGWWTVAWFSDMDFLFWSFHFWL